MSEAPDPPPIIHEDDREQEKNLEPSQITYEKTEEEDAPNPHRWMPKMSTHMRISDIAFEYIHGTTQLGLVFQTANMVVRSVAKTSPSIHHLVPGDQVVSVNGLLPLTQRDFETALAATKRNMLQLRVNRVWNVRVPSKQRMTKHPRRDNCTYLAIEMYLHPLDFGAQIKDGNRIRKIRSNSLASQCFIVGDRLLDIDGNSNVSQASFILHIKTARNAGVTSLSVLVERTIGNISTTVNPSAHSCRLYGEMRMLYDAAEIGCREAERQRFPLYRRAQPRSILKDSREKSVMGEPPTTEMADVEVQSPARSVTGAPTSSVYMMPVNTTQSMYAMPQEPPALPSPRSPLVKTAQEATVSTDDDEVNVKPRKKKKKGKSVRKRSREKSCQFQKPVETVIGTDVREPERLKKVTKSSGIAKFVRSFLQ